MRDQDPVVFVRRGQKVRESHMRRAREFAESIRWVACGAQVVLRGGRRAVVQPGVRLLRYLD